MGRANMNENEWWSRDNNYCCVSVWLLRYWNAIYLWPKYIEWTYLTLLASRPSCSPIFYLKCVSIIWRIVMREVCARGERIAYLWNVYGLNHAPILQRLKSLNIRNTSSNLTVSLTIPHLEHYVGLFRHDLEVNTFRMGIFIRFTRSRWTTFSTTGLLCCSVHRRRVLRPLVHRFPDV